MRTKYFREKSVTADNISLDDEIDLVKFL